MFAPNNSSEVTPSSRTPSLTVPFSRLSVPHTPVGAPGIDYGEANDPDGSGFHGRGDPRPIDRHVREGGSGGFVEHQIIGVAGHEVAGAAERAVTPVHVVQVRRLSVAETYFRYHRSVSMGALEIVLRGK